MTTINKNKVQILYMLIIFASFKFTYCSSGFSDDKESKIIAVIEKVVYETEEGYVVTNQGTFALPNPSTEVMMADTTSISLINKLQQVIGQEAILYIYDETIVGITSKNKGINFIPKYTKRKKMVYSSPPLSKTTVMNWWDVDTYRLSIKTCDGMFCIFNNYEVSDYRKKVFDKLHRRCEHGKEVSVKIIILYHENKDSYECPGEIEDIEFVEK